MRERETVRILGVEFDNVTLDQAAEKALELLAERRGAYVVTPNPEIVMCCRDDPAARAAVAGAALTIPDGIGVIYAARLRKTPLQERVPGIEFTARLLEHLSGTGGRVFLLGGKPGIAEAAAERLSAQYPGLVLCGTHDGYFSDDGPVIEAVNAAAPDLLLVCLGAPKQEIWMHRNAEQLRVGLMIGAGGSLDVFAGAVKRAPEVWQRLNLEWFYRLLHNPRRLGRMMQLPRFLLCALLEKERAE